MTDTQNLDSNTVLFFSIHNSEEQVLELENWYGVVGGERKLISYATG